MHVFHTAGVPPRRGKIILPTIGSTRKRNPALTKRVKEKTAVKIVKFIFHSV
jgi:hypothetical protein